MFLPINKFIFNILNCLLTWRGFLMTTSFENLNSLYTYGTNLCLHLTFISDFFCFFLKIWGWNKDTRWVALCRFWISFLWCMWLEKNVFFEGQSFTLDLLCHSAYCFSFVPCSWLFQSCLHNFWCMERVDNLMHSWILILYLHFFNIPLIVLYSLSLV